MAGIAVITPDASSQADSADRPWKINDAFLPPSFVTEELTPINASYHGEEGR